MLKQNIRIILFTLLISACSEAPQNSEASSNEHCQKACCENSRTQLLLDESLNESSITGIDSLHCLYSDSTMKMVYIPEGKYMMGASSPEMALKREFPQHQVKVNAFFMDIHEVTNAQFSAFVAATGYKTIAEQEIDWNVLKKQLPEHTPKPESDVLQPGSMVFIPTREIYDLIDISQWWRWTKGADWQHPEGPGSSIRGKEEEPVVHICYHDALAYAKWCNKRLPTEAEWEWAARGGLKNKIYPWGNLSVEKGAPKCNYWTGVFPTHNTKEDGYEGIAPIMQYEANGYGLFDMAGNVWEICSDWYDENYYSASNKDRTLDNPKGPQTWNYSLEPNDPKRVVRGGSFLCNDSYCSSYRVSARMPNSQDTGMSHTGFRCVKDIAP